MGIYSKFNIHVSLMFFKFKPVAAAAQVNDATGSGVVVMMVTLIGGAAGMIGDGDLKEAADPGRETTDRGRLNSDDDSS